ncbi:hypothetical protein [Enterococcus sp. DIV0800]|uniref:hypothetical protein n=1 Tax=unclassified Enterococcus TaxID=2608891 RepID=UPI003D2FC0D6
MYKVKIHFEGTYHLDVIYNFKVIPRTNDFIQINSHNVTTNGTYLVTKVLLHVLKNDFRDSGFDATIFVTKSA